MVCQLHLFAVIFSLPPLFFLLAPLSSLLPPGMVFNVNLGFANLTNTKAEDEASRVYALFIGDTVLVNEVVWMPVRGLWSMQGKLPFLVY